MKQKPTTLLSLTFTDSKTFHHFVIVVLSVSFQFFIFRNCFSNTIQNNCLPSALDSFDYANRARVFLDSGFSQAFADGFRVPGYPLVISLFMILFGDYAFVALRIFQVVITALTASMVYKALNDSFSKLRSFCLSIFFSFLPSWYFAPLLLAESLTYFLCICLVIVAIRVIKHKSFNSKDLIILCLLIVSAIYLKPNQILWIIPLFVLSNLIGDSKFLFSCLAAGIILACLVPWLFFVNAKNNSYFNLTTASGGNLYIGTGMIMEYNDGPLSKAAIFWKVDPKNNLDDVVSGTDKLSSGHSNRIYAGKALEIWRERPIRQIGFGIAKILIAFSIWSDSIYSTTLGAIFLFSLIGSVYALSSNKSTQYGKHFCVLYLSFVSILAVQAFVFQADRRFVFPILIPTWLFLLELFGIKESKLRNFAE